MTTEETGKKTWSKKNFKNKDVFSGHLRRCQQGGDSAAGTQALPVGKIIEDKVCRKDNQKGIANLHRLKDV